MKASCQSLPEPESEERAALRAELEDLSVDELRVRVITASTSTVELNEAEHDDNAYREVTFRGVVVSQVGAGLKRALIEIALACYDEAALEVEMQLLPGAVEEPLVPDRKQSKQKVAAEIFDKATDGDADSLEPKQTADVLTAAGVKTTKVWVDGIMSVVGVDGSGTVDRSEFPRVYMLALKKLETGGSAVSVGAVKLPPLHVGDGVSGVQALPQAPADPAPRRGNGRSPCARKLST